VRAGRPRFSPSYGISESEEGLLSWDWALEHLAASRNYWISTTRADGSPHAMPVWGVVHDGELWFGTGGVKAQNLARDGRLVAHAESGDEVVILEGTVEQRVVPDALLDEYDAKYDHRPEAGSRFWVVLPAVVYAWRERDYPTSATRFTPR
jgi:hypothetical protein